MLLAFPVEFENGRVGESLSARLAEIMVGLRRMLLFVCVLTGCFWSFLLIDGLLLIYFGDGCLPAEKTALLPFTLEHFLGLVLDFREINQGLRSLKKVL